MTQPAPRTVTWTPHYRVSWGGDIGVPGLDSWSNTVRFRQDDDLFGVGGNVMTHQQLEAVAARAAIILQAWMSDASSCLSTAARFNWVKVNFVNAQGLQPDQDTVMAEPLQLSAGSRGNVPWYISFVLTLRTAKARGRAHSGRIYPPVTTVPMEGVTPYCSLADATGMATAFARVLYALQEAFDAENPSEIAGVVAIVASPGDSASGKPPLFERITGVVCDRVPDVMHSRNRQVPRSEGALVAPGP